MSAADRDRGGVTRPAAAARTRRVVASALLIAAALVLVREPRPTVAAKSDAPALLRPYSNELPAGEGQTIAARSCLMCHSATLVTQQHKDSTNWVKTIGTMTKWGATLTPAEQDTLVLYLVQSFGPAAPR